MTPLLRFDGRQRCGAAGGCCSRASTSRSAPGEALQVDRPQRQRQVEPDPARRRPAARRARHGSSARALALADDHLALDRELPLRRALRFWSGRDVTTRWTRSASRQLADVPVRLLSTGQAQARDAGARRRIGAPLVAARRAVERPRRRRRGAARRGRSPRIARPAARSSPRRTSRSPATGARWSSAHDRRADRPRGAPRA